MTEIPFGFILVLLGLFVLAVLGVVIVHMHRQHALQRMQDPRHDHYRRG